jgi:hypothetical protein
MDIKTSKAIYPEHMVQLAAYHTLLADNGYEVSASYLIRVGRNDEEGFEFRELINDELVLAYEVFHAAFNLYRTKQAFEKIAA